ncbi:MAG: hypothetical protein ABIV21_02855 [Pyrinomonadaceae bacterium]
MKILSGFGNQSRTLISPHLTLFLLLVFISFVGACSVAEPRTVVNASARSSANTADSSAGANAPKGATITIEPEGPADTVRVFYKHLREKRFRDALFLTNLRPAIQGLTETELKDFSLDFEAIAGEVSPQIEINGEIITGDQATVTAMLPDNDTEKRDIQTFKLRREGDIWVIQTVDDSAAQKIKREGKNYFYQLRIDTHEEEARKMLERISKAELAYSLQNGGLFTDMQSLIGGGLLPGDVMTSESTGYVYAINAATDKKQYFATATPATYGKSGKLSFLLQLDNKGISHVTSKDNGGRAMRK